MIKYRKIFTIIIIITMVVCQTFGMSAETDKNEDSEIEKVLQKISSLINNDMTELEKALTVHDYIILNCSYDLSLTRFSAYDCLVEKSAVCLGYASAYREIMMRLGMECLAIVSWEMNHAWNYIKIDDNWYHVDLTWDDSLSNSNDVFGKVNHDNFMLSDEGIQNTNPPHYGWWVNDSLKATDKTYDDFFWQDIQSGIFKVGKYWYFLTTEKVSNINGEFKESSAHIKRYDFKKDKIKNVYTSSSLWYVWNEEESEEYFYTNNFSKFAVDADNGKLFFNTADCVYSIDLNGENLTKIVRVRKQDGYIYGITLFDGKLKYSVKKNPSDAGVIKTKTLGDEND